MQRSQDLQEVFSKEGLISTWKTVVRQQLRSQEILDLHDYYDFNFNIEEQSSLIQKKILNGQYRAKNPLIYKLEKKYGVCRHMMLPSPSDALVLQTIVERSLAEKLIQSQPTKRAYYSRDKHSLKLPHQLGSDIYLTWLEKWKMFQKKIWNFRKERSFLAVTDLANYYDNIGLRELRHVISSRAQVPEVILDLLFNIIEQLSWCPDYLPSSLKGLPTIALEAPRLLAHSLLFEVDEILESRTSECFVRWMDDINFGVDSVEEAYKTFGEVNDVLKSRGLALNLGKTAVYTFEEVKNHFLVDENEFLNSVENVDGILSSNTICELHQRFIEHKNRRNLRN